MTSVIGFTEPLAPKRCVSKTDFPVLSPRFRAMRLMESSGSMI